MPDLQQSATSLTISSFFSEGGEMGRLTRNNNWEGTSLGQPETWPQSLRTTLAIVLSSRFPMFLWWGPGLLCFYNDAYRPSLGVNGKHPQILGMPAQEAWSEIWHIIKPLIDEVLNEGKTVWREDQLIPIYRNGKIENVYWTFSYSPVINEAGKIGGVLVMCSDTTEKIVSLQKIIPITNGNVLNTNGDVIAQKNFINSFNQSEKKFRNAVMQAPVGITVLRGSNFFVEMANETYLDLIGHSEENFVGRPLFDSIPEAREAVETLLTNVFTSGMPYNTTEYPVPLNRFGKVQLAYFNFSYNVLREEDGNISGIIVIANDVTAMVKAKHTLAEDEKHFRDMVMQSPIPMAIFRGSDHIIAMANVEMFKNIWRKEEMEVLNKKLLEVFPELAGQKYPQIFDDVYATGNGCKESEAVAYITGNDGMKKFYLDYEYTPLFETDGIVSGIMVTVNDVTEKVAVRQKLEEGEARLRLATEGTKLATWDLDLETMEIVHSPRLAEIFGHPSSTKFTYQQIHRLIDSDDEKFVVEKAFEEAMITSVYDYEARVAWPDKTIHWVKTRGKVFYNEKHLPSRLIGTMMDVTGSKLNEIETGQLAAIVQTSEDAIISKKLNGIITSWNNAAERMFGYKAAEIIGQSIAILIPPDRIEEEAMILLQIQKGQGINSFQTKRVTKDKRILDISLTISPIKNARGNIIGASKIVRDITRQKEIETQVAASEAKFRLLANSMAQLIWIGDVDGSLNYYNQAVYDYAGLSFDAIQNNGWLQIVHPDDKEYNMKKWLQAINSGEDFILEHRFRRYDGQYRWQLSRAIPQRDADGKIQMWVGTSTDIHEIKENEQQKDFFISMASHELKTPVTSIKGYVQILMELYKDKGDDFLNNSLKNGQ